MPKNAAYCRDCGAHIVWARRYGAGAIPLDYEPDMEKGDYVLEGSGPMLVAVRSYYRWPDVDAGATLYTCHLDTCAARRPPVADAPLPSYPQVVKVWVSPNRCWAILWCRYGSHLEPTVFRHRRGGVHFDPALPGTVVKVGQAIRSESKKPDYVLKALLSEQPVEVS